MRHAAGELAERLDALGFSDAGFQFPQFRDIGDHRGKHGMRALGGIDEIAALEEEREFVAALADAVFDLKRPALREHALDFLPILAAVVGVDQHHPFLETAQKLVRENSQNRFGRATIERLVGSGVPLAENESGRLDGSFHAETRLAKGSQLGIQGGYLVRVVRARCHFLCVVFFHAKTNGIIIPPPRCAKGLILLREVCARASWRSRPGRRASGRSRRCVRRGWLP